MSTSSKKKAKRGRPSPPKKTKPKVTKPKKVEKKAIVAEEKPKKAAPKAKKTVERKEAPPKAVIKTEPLKLGPAPTAMIMTRHVDSNTMHQRRARGFSFGELASAGVPPNTVKHQDISVDIRRKSVVEQNVEMLKGWYKTSTKKK
jgi:ribosomal protein L13E